MRLPELDHTALTTARAVEDVEAAFSVSGDAFTEFASQYQGIFAACFDASDDGLMHGAVFEGEAQHVRRQSVVVDSVEDVVRADSLEFRQRRSIYDLVAVTCHEFLLGMTYSFISL